MWAPSLGTYFVLRGLKTFSLKGVTGLTIAQRRMRTYLGRSLLFMLGTHARGGALRRSLSRCLNTRSIDGLGAHARGWGVPQGTAILLEVSKHQVDQCTWCPRPGWRWPRGCPYPPSGCLNTRATGSPPIGPYYLRSMPTPKERCAEATPLVLSVSKHQGDQRNWCPHSEEAPPAAFLEASKHQDDRGTWCSSPRRGRP